MDSKNLLDYSAAAEQGKSKIAPSKSMMADAELSSRPQKPSVKTRQARKSARFKGISCVNPESEHDFADLSSPKNREQTVSVPQTEREQGKY